MSHFRRWIDFGAYPSPCDYADEDHWRDSYDYEKADQHIF